MELEQRKTSRGDWAIFGLILLMVVAVAIMLARVYAVREEVLTATTMATMRVVTVQPTTGNSPLVKLTNQAGDESVLVSGDLALEMLLPRKTMDGEPNPRNELRIGYQKVRRTPLWGEPHTENRLVFWGSPYSWQLW
jgi:hypothetical protein